MSARWRISEISGNFLRLTVVGLQQKQSLCSIWNQFVLDFPKSEINSAGTTGQTNFVISKIVWDSGVDCTLPGLRDLEIRPLAWTLGPPAHLLAWRLLSQEPCLICLRDRGLQEKQPGDNICTDLTCDLLCRLAHPNYLQRGVQRHCYQSTQFFQLWPLSRGGFPSDPMMDLAQLRGVNTS